MCFSLLAWVNLIAWAACSRAETATFPSRAIRAIVPFPAGGGVDTIARILQPKMQELLGQPFVIENRPGAAAIVGTQYVAKAPPDGYTLLFTLNPHIVNVYLYKNLPYNPISDFAPISLIATTPNVLVVNPNVGATSVKQLIDLAKARPGSLNYGTAGIGSPFHLAGALFDVMADVNIVAVPYPGGPQATLGLLGGQVQIVFGNLFNVLPYVKSGRLTALAVTSSHRLAIMPELPTVSEAGVPGYQFESWFGLLAPAGTPPEIIQRLYEAVRQATESPEIKQKIAAQGAELAATGPEQFAAFLQQEMKKWATIAPKAGLQPQ
jgi:tripartite-type tricarboxylate transporter receptor subunit TctC